MLARTDVGDVRTASGDGVVEGVEHMETGVEPTSRRPLVGLHHREAAHFSFLIATPIIIGAAVLEVPHLFRPEVAHAFNALVWIAGAVAGITAYLSTAFLMRYFRRHDFEALDPFAYYCWAAGALSLVALLLMH